MFSVLDIITEKEEDLVLDSKNLTIAVKIGSDMNQTVQYIWTNF